MKIISLNVEGQKHLPLVDHFLTTEHPDVVCLQECFAVDLPQLQAEEMPQRFFVPHTVISAPNRYGIATAGEWGIAILVRAPWQVTAWHTHVYHGDAQHVPNFIDGNPNSVNRAVLLAEISDGTKTYTIATTHFTWTQDGETSTEQLEDWQNLQHALAPYPELIFCGDLNAPRGKKLGNMIESAYQSHVPASVTTTIDEQFHYAGKLNLVVDYFLTKGNIQVKGVEVKHGVSDHCALVATLS